MTNRRIGGLDITRGIAVFGMILMNYHIVTTMMGQGRGGTALLDFFEGRFGALFVFLAGLGVSLMTRRGRKNPEELKAKRLILTKRALFLLVTGMSFSLFWQADILHFYAFYLLLALPLLRAPKGILWVITFTMPFLFLALNFLFPWETGWDFNSFHYAGFYQPVGFLRNLFYNGFHPVIPWMGFFTLGMVFGRYPLKSRRILRDFMILGALLLLLSEVISAFLLSSVTLEEGIWLFSTAAFPPFPLFFLSAAGGNLLLTSLVLRVFYREESTGFIRKVLQLMGKTVLTQYVFHLLIGLPPLLVLMEKWSIGVGAMILYSLLWSLISVGLTLLWYRRFKAGPLEILMRKFSG